MKAKALRGKDTGGSHFMLSQRLPEFAKIGEFSWKNLAATKMKKLRIDLLGIG